MKYLSMLIVVIAVSGCGRAATTPVETKEEKAFRNVAREFLSSAKRSAKMYLEIGAGADRLLETSAKLTAELVGLPEVRDNQSLSEVIGVMKLIASVFGTASRYQDRAVVDSLLDYVVVCSNEAERLLEPNPDPPLAGFPLWEEPSK